MKEFGGKVSAFCNKEPISRCRHGGQAEGGPPASTEHYRPDQLLGLAWAGETTGRFATYLHRPALWAPALALVLAMGSALYWQQTYLKNDSDDIDALLLSSDLPIHAYIDKDFDAWPNGSSR
jgi:hypothetical protein